MKNEPQQIASNKLILFLGAYDQSARQNAVLWYKFYTTLPLKLTFSLVSVLRSIGQNAGGFLGRKKKKTLEDISLTLEKNLRCSVLTLKLAQDKIHRIGVHNLSSELDHERQAGILDTNNLVIWDLRNPHHNLRFETDLKEQAMAATKSNLPSTQRHRSPSCVYAQTIQG